MIDYNTLQEILDNLNKRIKEIEVREQRVTTVWHQVHPTVVQGVAIAISSDSVWWAQIGKVAFLRMGVIFGSNGIANQGIQVQLPPTVPPAANVFGWDCRGTFIYYAPGRAFFSGGASPVDTRTWFFIRDGTPYYMGAIGDVQVLAGDQLSFTAVYQVQ